MDEKPYQLLDDLRAPIPMQLESLQKQDGYYKRNGTCRPIGRLAACDGCERRTKIDWQIRDLLMIHYPNTPKIRLVMDNLNTYSISSLYEAFPPEIARSLAKRLEIHYTPKHGSWLNKLKWKWVQCPNNVWTVGLHQSPLFVLNS